MARTRQGTWTLLSAAGAMGLVAGAACVPPEDTTPSYEGSCPILVECASVFSPDVALFDEFNAIYGEDGSCWENGTLQHSRCRDSCVAALDTYNVLVAASGVSCGLCIDDGDCAEFGADATCTAGYCARGQLGEVDTAGDEDSDGSGNGGIGLLEELPPLDDACDVETPRVAIDTNYGLMVVEVDRIAEPVASENFLGHVSANYYDNMLFHRVIDGDALHSGLIYDGLGLTSPVSESYTGSPSITPTGNELALILTEGRISGAFYVADGSSSGTGVPVGTLVSGLDVRDEISAVEVLDVQWNGFLLEKLPREDVLISTVYCE